MVVLHKLCFNAAGRFEGLLVITLEEKPALVTKDAGLDDENVGN
jgi:hypothetical protein